MLFNQCTRPVPPNPVTVHGPRRKFTVFAESRAVRMIWMGEEFCISDEIIAGSMTDKAHQQPADICITPYAP